MTTLVHDDALAHFTSLVEPLVKETVLRFGHFQALSGNTVSEYDEATGKTKRVPAPDSTRAELLAIGTALIYATRDAYDAAVPEHGRFGETQTPETSLSRSAADAMSELRDQLARAKSTIESLREKLREKKKD